MSWSRAILALGLACAGACSRAHEAPAALSPALVALLARCDAAVSAAPQDAKARAELALAFEANGRWEEAAQNYLKASELQPDEALWALHAAICETEAGELERARQSLETAAAHFPKCAGILQRQGVALFLNGEFVRARSAYAALTRLEPLLAEGWTGLAEVEFATGNFPAALEAAEHALRLDASYPWSRSLRGRCLYALGREQEAQAELARAGAAKRRMLGDAWSARSVEFAVGFEARFAQAVLLFDQGHKAEALAAFETLTREHPKDVRTLGNLALAQAAAGDFAAALATCDAALAIEPNLAALHAARARVWLGAKHAQDAIASAQRATELDPRDAGHFELLGFALSACGEDSAALSAWKTALQLDPTKADLRKRVEFLERK